MQVIEVQLINTAAKQVIHQSFTRVNTHREAIDLAVNKWSEGQAVIKRVEQEEDQKEPVWVSAPGGAWRNVYYVILENPENPEGTGYELMAVLFAEYKQDRGKEQGNGN